jgi:hypothetical protein
VDKFSSILSELNPDEYKKYLFSREIIGKQANPIQPGTCRKKLTSCKIEWM